jgi:hypothetical protein
LPEINGYINRDQLEVSKTRSDSKLSNKTAPKSKLKLATMALRPYQFLEPQTVMSATQVEKIDVHQ